MNRRFLAWAAALGCCVSLLAFALVGTDGQEPAPNEKLSKDVFGLATICSVHLEIPAKE
jgi:hypothetical protein